jgi:hypothetical protein
MVIQQRSEHFLNASAESRMLLLVGNTPKPGDGFLFYLVSGQYLVGLSVGRLPEERWKATASGGSVSEGSDATTSGLR